MASRILTRPAIRRGSIREFFGSDPNLKGCWSLNGHARDESGNGNHGTATGAVPYTDGYYFGTTTQTISCGNVLNFERTDTFSFLVCAYNFLSTNRYEMLLSKTQDVPPYPGYIIQKTDVALGHLIEFGLCNGAVSNHMRIRSSLPVLQNRLFFLAVTYNGSSSASGALMYLNGSKIATSVINNTLSATIQTTKVFSIGNRDTPVTNVQAWDGLIRNTGVFSKVLSPAEISQYYQWAISKPRKYWYYSPTVITFQPWLCGACLDD